MQNQNYLDQIDIEEENGKQRWQRIKPIRNNRWDIIFQSTIAPIFPIKTLSEKTGGRVSHLNDRKSTESQLEGFGINLNFQIQNKRGFVITTGLEYQQFNEKYDRKESSVRTENIIGVIAIVENANGQTIRNLNNKY